MKFRYKKAYLKRFKRFSYHEKELIIEADNQIRNYYTSYTASYGLRIKKFYDDGTSKVFEARVSDKLRILWVELEDLVSFTFLGNHDEVKNFIKSFR